MRDEKSMFVLKWLNTAHGDSWGSVLGYFKSESSSSLLHQNHAGFRRNIMIHSVATSFLGSSDR